MFDLKVEIEEHVSDYLKHEPIYFDVEVALEKRDRKRNGKTKGKFDFEAPVKEYEVLEEAKKEIFRDLTQIKDKNYSQHSYGVADFSQDIGFITASRDIQGKIMRQLDYNYSAKDTVLASVTLRRTVARDPRTVLINQ